MRPSLFALAALLSGACGPDGDGSGLASNPPTPAGRGGDCGENLPVIQELTADVSAPQWYESAQGDQGRLCLPTVTLTILPFDEDGALHYYLMDAWWDDVVDGRVLPEGQRFRIEGSLSNEECSVTSAGGINMRLGIGGEPPNDTEIEFGVVLENADGLRSNDGTPMTVSVVTPSPVSSSACD
ncbi:MAG: hypothetical protein EA397_10915 [Deltaproteobacteria bacterium]|nr:MAG: hypothetical protein EA397_10915 [Deltaproteobacteria bacterium]